ncbi:kinase-like domain-containing protein [Aspergillus terricola var. indicus]
MPLCHYLIMTRSIHALWSDILQQKKDEVLYNTHPTITSSIPSTYTVDSSLRTEFEDFCRTIRERDYTRLLGRLRCDRIDIFARAVDSALEYKPPGNLAGLISAALFITIQCGYQAGVLLRDVIDLMAPLNRAVPSLDCKIPHNTPHVHGPLRAIVEEYLDCLVFIKLRFLDGPPIDRNNVQEIQTRTAEATAIFRQEKDILKSALRQPYVPEHHSIQPRYPDSTGPLRFEQQELLGRGSFGDVYKVIERSTRQVYALKQIPLGSDPDRRRVLEEKVRNECDVMRKLSHLHIINVSMSFVEQGQWSIIMDVVADINLRSYLEQCSRDNYRDSALAAMLPWFGCLTDALNFAHRCKVIHNDIKPSNILIEGDKIYLADFGLSSDFTALENSRSLEYIHYGTPEYKAPEMRPGQPPSRKADVFSLGCVFTEMLTVHSRTSLRSFREYRSHETTGTESSFRGSLPSVRDWLQRLKDNSERPLFVLYYQILEMIEEDPGRRASAEDVRKSLLGSGHGNTLFCSMHL